MEHTVRLQPMTAERYHAYFREYVNDPDLYIDKSKFAPYVYSPELTDRYIQRQTELGRKCFAILYGDETVGELILKNIEPRRCATLSICMKNADCKDRGFGTQAELLAIDYVFHDLDIPVLYADAILSNTRSQHVLEKVGFRLLRVEGDFKYYSIERPDREPETLLETDRLLVRRFTPEDAATLHAVLSDPKVMRYLEPPFTPEQTENFIRDAGLCDPPLVWAVVWKDKSVDSVSNGNAGTGIMPATPRHVAPSRAFHDVPRQPTGLSVLRTHPRTSNACPYSLSTTDPVIARSEATRQSVSPLLIGHLIWHPWDETAMELGWVLRRDFWGRGIAKELTAALLARTNRDVVIECSPGQSATRHIAEIFGFALEETRPELLRYRKRGKPAQIDGGNTALPGIKWIFFDLGSTLIDETEADERRIKEMTAGTAVTPETYREKRLEFLRQGLSGDAAAIAFFGLTKAPWHSELERPYPDAAPVLAELKRRGYRLGVIANQNPGTEGRLAAWDLLRYFDVVAPSAELGVAKPDPAIFQWALKRAGCEASEAVMVGDRLDNDIVPAKALGFRTVRLLRGLGALQVPRSAAEEPEHTIRGLAELLDLMPCNAERADVGIGPYGGSRN